MVIVPKANVVVTYNGKDISKDITSHLLSVSYTDHVKGKSDEIELGMEDTDGLWKNDWYPEKGDTVNVKIDFDGVVMDCGDFIVDEIELQGPPDTVSIRGMAASVKKSLRTKKSKAHEKKTLKDIAQATAAANGLTLVDGAKKVPLDKIRFERSTQNRETDLEYLRRLAEMYGYSFSVRGTKMQFYHLDDLEGADPVLRFDRTELMSYSFTDKTSKVYKKAKVTYHDPKTADVVSGEHEPEPQTNADGESTSDITSDDTLEIRAKVENKTQADQAAKAALHEHNSKTQEGSVSLPGNPLLVSGNNIELTGMGRLSGKFHLCQSTHKIDKGGGYTCDLDLKRVAPSVAKSEYTSPSFMMEPAPRDEESSSSNINYFQGDLAIFREKAPTPPAEKVDYFAGDLAIFRKKS